MRKFFVLSLAIVSFIIAIMLNINSLNVLAKSNEIIVNAKSYVVTDINGNILLENKSDERREVASICKLMTTLLTLNSIDSGKITLEDKFYASQYACGVEGSQAFLDAGSEYCVKELLKSVIVASANDSAIVLAEGIAGSENRFVDMMNDMAQNLGMKNTLYANATGLDDIGKEQYSTAYDTSILLNEVSKYEIYQKDCQIWMDKLVHPSGRETELVNTNRLIKYYDYCLTGKTGFTDGAGYCLSSTAKKNNMKLTCVVLGCNKSADRFTDSISLYNYAYANFENKQVVSKDALIDNNILIQCGKFDYIKLSASDDYYITQSISNKKDCEIKYVLPEKLKAPINKGSQVGVMEIYFDGKLQKEIPIICCEDIEKQNYGNIINKIIDKFAIIN